MTDQQKSYSLTRIRTRSRPKMISCNPEKQRAQVPLGRFSYQELSAEMGKHFAFFYPLKSIFLLLNFLFSIQVYIFNMARPQ